MAARISEIFLNKEYGKGIFYKESKSNQKKKKKEKEKKWRFGGEGVGVVGLV